MKGRREKKREGGGDGGGGGGGGSGQGRCGTRLRKKGLYLCRRDL